LCQQKIKNTMRKLFSFIVALTFASIATAQIPNPGFENWTGTAPTEYPDGWWTVDMIVPAGGVTKSTDAHSGSFAASAQVVALGGGNNFPGVIALNDPTTDSTFNGIPFTGMPDTLKVWMKYNTDSNDQALILVQLTAWDSRVDSVIVVGGGGGTITGTQSTYVLGIIPIEYSIAIAPDSIQIIIMVGDFTNPQSPTGTVGSYVIVDDLELVSAVTVKISDITLTNKVSIYPNPNNGSFSMKIPAALDNSILTILDIAGKEVYSQNINSGLFQLNTNAMAGQYFVRIQNEKHTINKSIIIEEN
jgi:hypothetical protein